MVAPKLVFIIPYRDRVNHKQFFTKYIDFILEDYKKEDYEIFFSHQCDNRPFNRGAMKNIGFLAIKQKYPEEYKNITFVFNDVDTLPYTKNLLPYETVHGIVKHFYGFTFALGGIFSITGGDFEKTNGFPNLWGWSQEDNVMDYRVRISGLKIDRSIFFKILDTHILQFTDNVKKMISKKEIIGIDQNYKYGLNSLSNITMKFENEYINIYNFTSETIYNATDFSNHNILTESKIHITSVEKRRFNKSNGMGNGMGNGRGRPSFVMRIGI
jgi:hypothetical protein